MKLPNNTSNFTLDKVYVCQLFCGVPFVGATVTTGLGPGMCELTLLSGQYLDNADRGLRLTELVE